MLTFALFFSRCDIRTDEHHRDGGRGRPGVVHAGSRLKRKGGRPNTGSWFHKSTNTPLHPSRIHSHLLYIHWLLGFVLMFMQRYCPLYLFVLICKKKSQGFRWVVVSVLTVFFISVLLDLKDELCAGQETNILGAQSVWFWTQNNASDAGARDSPRA